VLPEATVSFACVQATKQFVRDLEDLGDEMFEQFVFAIVLKSYPNAQKTKAPDFGADVLDDPASLKPRVWQVKHYPHNISWTKCQESLDRAYKKWRPSQVTFVFPQDLSGLAHQTFNDKLVGRQPVDVDRWTASRLNEAVERYPELRRSYFPDRTDQLQEVLRAAQLSRSQPMRARCSSKAAGLPRSRASLTRTSTSSSSPARSDWTGRSLDPRPL
jgi:hypothetical protein